MRRQGIKATTAATILGAFLAFPHLLGHGVMPQNNISPQAESLTHERTVEAPTNMLRNNSDTNLGITQGTTSITTPEPNAPKPDSPTPNVEKKKSQGHQYGRSYLAPPKDHGLHDLGLHRGEDKGKGNAQAPGPHPEELEVRHKGDQS